MTSGVVQSSIIAKVNQKSIVAVSPTVLSQLTKLVVGLGVTDPVDELLDYLAANVNPRELIVPPNWYAEMLDIVPKRHICCRLTLCEMHHDPNVVARMARPNPDQARLISPTMMRKLQDTTGVMDIIENAIQSKRDHLMAPLSEFLGKGMSLTLFRRFTHQLIRVALNLTRLPDFAVSCGGGPMTQEKVDSIYCKWIGHIVERHPGVKPVLQKAGVDWALYVIDMTSVGDGEDDEVGWKHFATLHG
jgi:hypothetical protein